MITHAPHTSELGALSIQCRKLFFFILSRLRLLKLFRQGNGLKYVANFMTGFHSVHQVSNRSQSMLHNFN